MAQQRQSIHGEWSSRWAFILAATGAAVGLGNIWKFPYITGENGGGAFVLIYLLCILLVGIPVMMAEIMIGRMGRQNPTDTMKTVAIETGRSKHWQWVGALGILSSFIILSYYTVIAGWVLDYVFKAGSGAFLDQSAAGIDSLFSDLTNSPWIMLSWSTTLVALTVFIVAKGVQKGLERTVRYLLPTMFVLLLVMVGYAMQTGHFEQGIRFLFQPDFSKLTTASILTALGHAFFTLSLASGIMMMYGAYLPNHVSVVKVSVIIAVADTTIALLAGMAIFPIVFANELNISGGPGLIFHSLPIAFGEIPYGTLFGAIFFVMLLLAAFTSMIALMEPSVAWLIERFHVTRNRAALYVGLGIWLMGIGTVLSFNYWSEITLFGKNFFDMSDFLTANIFLPLGGLLTVLFAAWRLTPIILKRELHLERSKLFKWWYITARYISPLAIIIVFLGALGVF